MRCHKAARRVRGHLTRALDAVLLSALVYACDSGEFVSHPDPGGPESGPVKLAFIAQPAAALVGAAMRPVIVAVQDGDGNNMPNARASITVAIGTNPGAGALSGTTTLPAVGGVAVFSDLVIDKPGSGYTLTAEGSGLPKATSGLIEVDVTLPASHVAFSVQPGGSGKGLVNVALSPAVQVSILDELGNVVTSSTMDVTVAIATGSAGATLSGTSTVAAVKGVATFDLSIDTAGSYTLAASASSLVGATSAPFEVLGSAAWTPGCLTMSFPPLVGTFGFQTIGTSSAPQRFTITNTCAADQGVLAGAVFNFYNWQDWSARSDCPQVLGPWASCTLDVIFSPTGPGDRFGLLTINVGQNEGSLGVVGTAIGRLSMSVAPDPSGASGGFVYVANADTGSISMYRIDRDTGVLAHLAPPSISAGTNPASVAVDPSGKFAYVANAGSDSVSMYTIGADGVLTPIGPPVATGTFPVSVAVAPDPAGGPGRFAYVANARSSDVSMYSIDPGTGALTSLGTTAVAPRPWFVAVHPSGKFAYTGESESGDIAHATVYAYAVDGGTGALTAAGQATCNLFGGLCEGNVPSALAVDPSGRYVALTTQGDLSLTLWDTDPTTGVFRGTWHAIGLVEQTATSLAISAPAFGWPTAYVAYGTGAFASRPGNPANSVWRYAIDPSTSRILSLAGSAEAGLSPTSIAIEPSGRFAYVANAGSGDISMYGIIFDGTLTPLVPGTIGL